MAILNNIPRSVSEDVYNKNVCVGDDLRNFPY